MATVIEMRRRAGMGGLGDGYYDFDPSGELIWYEDPAAAPNYGPGNVVGQYPSSTPVYNPTNQPGIWTQAGPSLVAGIIKQVGDILKPSEVSIAQARYGQPTYQGQQQPLSNEQLAVLLRQQQSGASGGVGAQAEQFVTKYWIVLLIGAGILFFPGFSRRK